MDKIEINDGVISVGLSDLLGSVAFYGVYQDPYHSPKDLQKVIDKLKIIAESEFDNICKDYYYKEFNNRSSLYDWVDKKLKSIPEFVDWNLSQVEREKGIKVDDPNRSKILFTSRIDIPKKEYDFIDLDALINNVVYLLYKLKED